MSYPKPDGDWTVDEHPRHEGFVRMSFDEVDLDTGVEHSEFYMPPDLADTFAAAVQAQAQHIRDRENTQ